MAYPFTTPVRWRGRMWIGGREYTKSGFELRRDAEAWETANRGQRQQGVPSLADWLDAGGRKATLAAVSPATKKTYASNLKVRIVPDLGVFRLDAITPAMIEEYRDEWFLAGRSVSTVNGTLNTLARVYKHAIKARVVVSNPMEEVERLPDAASERVPVLSFADIERLAVSCEAVDPLYADYVRVAAHLGVRAGEVTALRVGDVDFDDRRVHVRRAYSAEVLGPPKGKKPRAVPLSREIEPVLRRLAEGRDANESLFVDRDGERLVHWKVRDNLDWNSLVDRMGWKGFRFHDLRGSAIVEWLHRGVSPATVQAMAGHESLRTTERYVRVARNDLATATAQIDAGAAP